MRTFESEQDAALTYERHTPASQFLEWGNCPRGDDVKCLINLVGPTADNTHLALQTELFAHLFQKHSATQQRLNERHAQVRPGDRPHQSWQPGTAAHIGDRRALLNT